MIRLPLGHPSALRHADSRNRAVSGAGSTAIMSQAAPSSSATICGSAVQMPWPVSACGTATVTWPSLAILMKLPNACSPRSTARSLPMCRGHSEKPTTSPTPTPPPISNVRRSTFNAVLGLEGSAVDLARAEARQRRIEKMIRSGILNLASLRRGTSRRSSSHSCSLVLRKNDRDRHFAEPFVRRSEDRDFRNVGQA